MTVMYLLEDVYTLGVKIAEIDFDLWFLMFCCIEHNEYFLIFAQVWTNCYVLWITLYILVGGERK